ncbi:hypothetical protein [Nonlabens sp.]|uniref:hypothetical protein n=1 Tax=Nonlabens sp. TaxID=1888209 RepID=UPI003F6A0C52
MKLKNIKDQMDKREIAPSAGSWDALASRLETEEKKNKKPLIYWLGAIAAVLIAAVLLYPALNDDHVVNYQVDETVVIIEDQRQEIVDDKLSVNEILKAQESKKLVDHNTNTVQKKEEVIIEKSPAQEQYIVQLPQKESVRKEKPQQETFQMIDNLLPQEPVESTLDDTTITSNENPVVIEKVLTAEEEMELLLNKAMKKVEQPAIAVKSINPDLLLMETEWDIESDQRSRLQNSIQDGLNFLKTEAVALIDK